MSARAAVVLAVGLVVAAFVHAGVYEVVTAGSGGGGGSHEDVGHTGNIAAFRLNRFTGSMVACQGAGCVESRVLPFPAEALGLR